MEEAALAPGIVDVVEAHEVHAELVHPGGDGRCILLGGESGMGGEVAPEKAVGLAGNHEITGTVGAHALRFVDGCVREGGQEVRPTAVVPGEVEGIALLKGLSAED